MVVESSTDPVVGILYHITPKGPRFPSLYDLIEKAQQEAVIKNHLFEIVLGKCPPKVWLSLSLSLSLMIVWLAEGSGGTYKCS